MPTKAFGAPSPWIDGPAALLAAVAGAAMAVAPHVAFAVDYLSVDQAQKIMFPDATEFESRGPVLLSRDLAARIAGQGNPPANSSQWRVFAAKAGDRTLGYVATDAVIGKFQFINYAVAFGTDGAIRDVEILSYREEHGAEVRTAAWRKQFSGKTGAAPLKIDDDIDNISGATMSCTHLTDGIRNLTRYVQLAIVSQPEPATQQ